MRLKFTTKQQEVGEVWSFFFQPTEALIWQAGQYLNLTMPGVSPAVSDRLFTIASAPSEQTVRIVTYLGPSDFKQRLAQLTTSETIEADQLGGDFVWQADGRPRLFIAGGIGVTPFRSMVVDGLYKRIALEARLLYAGKDDRRPFVDELREAEQQDKTFQITDYVQERLNLERLLHDVPDALRRTVYIAGSQSFSERLGEGLVAQGLARDQLKYDYFDGYSDLEYA